MKTIALLTITLLMFSAMTSLVLAEEIEVDDAGLNVSEIVEINVSEIVEINVSETFELEEDAGIGPGSRMYWFDNMGDRIRFAFAFGNVKKAQVGLEIAEEKLAEIEALEDADPALLDKARARYEQYIERATSHMEKVEARTENKTGDAVERLEQMRNRLELHHGKAVQTKMRILARNAENMTDEQLEQLEDVFGRIENRTLKSKKQLDQKEDRLKSIYQLRTNTTEEEAGEFFAQIRSEHQGELREGISENGSVGQRIRSRMNS